MEGLEFLLKLKTKRFAVIMEPHSELKDYTLKLEEALKKGLLILTAEHYREVTNFRIPLFSFFYHLKNC